MDNIRYNCSITYGICESLGRVYSFFINVNDRSYFPVLPIKYLINEYSKPTTPFKFVTGTKPSVSHLRVLFSPCVVRKATAHVGKKVSNMCHQSQKGFCFIFVGIPQNQIGYLVYVPGTSKIISSYGVFLLKFF